MRGYRLCWQLKMIVEWFEKEANQVDPEKDALEDRLVDLYKGWHNQMLAFLINNPLKAKSI